MFPSRTTVVCFALTLASSLSYGQQRKAIRLENAEHVIVLKQEGTYVCFPFLPKTQPQDGVYMSVGTRTKASHIDRTGGTAIMRSTDGCRTWEVFQKSEEGVKPEESNALLATRTPDGTLLMMHTGWDYYPADKRAELEAAGWHMMDAREGVVAALSGHSARLSRDGGATWEDRELPLPNPAGIMNFHGGIVTDEGVILWPVYGPPTRGDLDHSYVYRSTDSGRTWTFHEIIGDSRGELPMNETSLVDLGGGHILAFVRTGRGADHMFRAESFNGGVTWGRLADSGIKGHPPDLLKLANGHILLTYGYRHEPFGIRACISKDNGQTWGDEYILRDDGLNGDIGYPMSIQLADGTIFTTYYFKTADGITHVAGTLWREP
jgi:sialidase-1